MHFKALIFQWKFPIDFGWPFKVGVRETSHCSPIQDRMKPNEAKSKLSMAVSVMCSNVSENLKEISSQSLPQQSQFQSAFQQQESGDTSQIDPFFGSDLVTEYLVWKTIGRVGPGFNNLGNTCKPQELQSDVYHMLCDILGYFNSTLQCLMYLPPLVQLCAKVTAKPVDVKTDVPMTVLAAFLRCFMRTTQLG